MNEHFNARTSGIKASFDTLVNRLKISIRRIVKVILAIGIISLVIDFSLIPVWDEILFAIFHPGEIELAKKIKAEIEEKKVEVAQRIEEELGEKIDEYLQKNYLQNKEDKKEKEDPVSSIELKIVENPKPGVIREVTGYNGIKEQTDGDPCIAASGIDICRVSREQEWLLCAVNAFNLWTVLEIDKVGKCVNLDKMNGNQYKNRVDLFFDQDIEKAKKFGKQKLIVTPIGEVEKETRLLIEKHYKSLAL